MKRQELTSLIEQWLDGTIPADDLARLKTELLSSRDALEHYLEMAEMHSLLGQALATPLPQHNVIPVDRVIRRAKRKSLRVATLAAAAVVMIGLVAMAFFMVRETPPTVAFETTPGTYFEITHSSSDDDTPAGQTLEAGSRLQLSQGSVELTFATGVRSVVIAPADLTLHDDNKLHLNRGTAWFHVPAGAEGFQVTTQDLDIIDLGTEFGVTAGPDKHDEIHVLKGKVEVTAQRVRKQSAVLAAGQSRRADPVGRLDTIPPQTALFLTTLPKSLPAIRWTFDGDDAFQASGNHPAMRGLDTVPAGSPALVPGRHGNALSLNGNGQYLATNWPGFAGDRPRTVAVWLKLSPGGDHTALSGIVGWGDAASSNGKWKILAVQDQPGGKRKLRLSLGDYWLTGTSDLADDRWHHVVVTASGQLDDNGRIAAEFYIDGKREPTTHASNPGKARATGFDTLTDSSGSAPLLIGSSLQADRAKRFFMPGKIDEITIIDGHLDADAVRDFYQQSLKPSADHGP